jgi:outer membrane lipoprotein-sorting protein
MKKSRISISFLFRQSPLLLLILICSGCAAISTKYRPLPPLADPHTYLQTILDAQKPACFSATARIKSQSPQGRLSAHAAVFARASTSLRIELYGFLNQLVFLCATDGTTINIFYPYSSSFYTGSAADKNLSLLFGGDVSAADALALLCGQPAIIPFQHDRFVGIQDNKFYQFELISDTHLRQTVLLDPVSKKVAKYILYNKAGKALQEFSFGDFSSLGDFTVPMKIALVFHESNTRLTIDYSEIKMPHRLDDTLFILTPPAGVKVYSLNRQPQKPLLYPQ